MLFIWPSLVFLLFKANGAYSIKALPTSPSILNINAASACTEYVDVNVNGTNPVIYQKKNIKKGSIICINASSIYMSVIFHSWKNFEAKTFHISNKPKQSPKIDVISSAQPINVNTENLFNNHEINGSQPVPNVVINNNDNETIIIEDGPYKENDNSIIGFYFGRFLGQVQLKALKNNAMLSFGSIVFHDKSTLRIISNAKQDTLKFTEPSNLQNKRPCHRHIQYFNGLPGSQSYNIEMNIDEEEDYLNFRNSKKCSMNFTGELSIQKKTTEEEPQILNFFTNKNYNLAPTEPRSNGSSKERKLDVYLEIDETSNSFKSKKYGRLWTSSGKYATIPAFSYSEYSTAWIILTVVLVVVFVVATVALISFIIFKKRKSRFIKCNESCEQGIDNNEDNESIEKAPKKKRRLFFESIVEICHAPKNIKEEPKNQSQKRDDALKISQNNLLEREDEH